MNTPQSRPSTDGSRRVLVIDDDPTILQLVQTLLAEEGYTVDTALDGQQALDSAAPRPEVVVLDMYLPGISGASLADKLRAKHGQDVRIVVMSASSVAEEAGLLGAAAYIAKPFDLDELSAAVRRVLAG